MLAVLFAHVCLAVLLLPLLLVRGHPPETVLNLTRTTATACSASSRGAARARRSRSHLGRG